LETIGKNIVATDETNMSKARKRFGPRELTATDETTWVNA